MNNCYHCKADREIERDKVALYQIARRLTIIKVAFQRPDNVHKSRAKESFVDLRIIQLTTIVK